MYTHRIGSLDTPVGRFGKGLRVVYTARRKKNITENITFRAHPVGIYCKENITFQNVVHV